MRNIPAGKGNDCLVSAENFYFLPSLKKIVESIIFLSATDIMLSLPRGCFVLSKTNNHGNKDIATCKSALPLYENNAE